MARGRRDRRAGDGRAADDGRFFSRVYALVRSIPRGRVVTYGQVAHLLGQARGARAVGWALRALDSRQERRVPWHRVVGAGGRISLRAGVGPLVQRRRLEDEGVRFRRGRIDLGRDGWLRDQITLTRGRPRRSRARWTV